MKQIEELGKQMSGVFHREYTAEASALQMQAINEGLAKLAMEITGIRADQLADENLENKPIVRLYWTTLSQLTQLMFLEAARHQSYYREADR